MFKWWKYPKSWFEKVWDDGKWCEMMGNGVRWCEIVEDGVRWWWSDHTVLRSIECEAGGDEAAQPASWGCQPSSCVPTAQPELGINTNNHQDHHANLRQPHQGNLLPRHHHLQPQPCTRHLHPHHQQRPQHPPSLPRNLPGNTIMGSSRGLIIIGKWPERLLYKYLNI